jgi:signal transduction histidine kinase
MNSPGNFWHMPANRPLPPNVLDLNDTVEGMLKMLRRLIGEDIDLAWLLEAGLWLVKMDPAQIDQILANLCIYARDAHLRSGKNNYRDTQRPLRFL